MRIAELDKKMNADKPTAWPSLRGLAPILPVGPIRALLLGSFPSVASLESGQYYGNPQNRFWRVLAQFHVIQDPDAPYAARVAAVRCHGLAIWDLYARVRRQGSGDDRIRDVEPNPVEVLLAERGPFPILLNGRRAREWRQHFGALQAEVVELPSTSPRRCTGTRRNPARRRLPSGALHCTPRESRRLLQGPRSLKMKIVRRVEASDLPAQLPATGNRRAPSTPRRARSAR